MVIIRYAHAEVRDQYICGRITGQPGGYWRSGQNAGRENALQFANEGCAKSFLAIHGYDLPPLKVTFETI